ncbi:MAG: translation initiation factor IF-2 [Eubacterium sp.]|nr:translation initiation factor IF-2 [Eubacterium sp.]
MRISDFAKELTKETGKQVTPNQIIMLLSKKKDGLRALSNIDDDLMEYAKLRITGKSATAAKPAPAAKPAAKTTTKTSKKSTGTKTDAAKADGTKKPSSSTKAAAKKPASPVRPGGRRLTASTRPDAVIVPKPKAPEKKEEAVKETVEKKEEEVKTVAEVKETPVVEPVKEAAPVVEEKKEPVVEKKEAPAVVEEKTEVVEKAPEKEEVKEVEKAPVKEEVKEEKPVQAKEEEKAKQPAKTDKPRKPESKDKAPRSDRNDREDRGAKNDRSRGPRKDEGERNSRDDRGDKRKRDGRSESSEAPMDGKKSSRKGDKSKDKEKEARREGRETRAGKRDDRRNKKNDFRDMDEMGERKKKPVKKQEKKEEETIKTITLPESLTLSEFASKIKQPVNALIKKLFLEGKMYTVNTELTYEEAELIALEYNIICEEEVKVDLVEEALKDIEDPEDSLVTRPPVVCVMGHVDHGKTSLLDAIRETSVTEGEAGGITQHIGAYMVKANGKKITFLDTPGHEAFTSMRLRGAMATDIAILVVAADDGVMPQTVEAINHAKAAGVQIIVAVNKIDKPSANIERVKQELVEYGLIAEDWGGDTIFCPVSAKSREGLDNLLEMILLTSDILELKANPARKARGIVIEAKLDKGRGAVATLLVQKGTLKVGDFIAIGESHGRVRAMTDDKQRNLKEATPSMPVEIIGLSTVPNSGEIFIATDSEKEARSISDAFVTRGKENLIAETKAKMSLDDIFSQMQEGTLKELNIIIKADVQGSVEALKQSLLKLSNEEVIIKCIHSGVGAINESDVSLAAASNAIIIGFNVRTEPLAKSSADTEKVDIRLYRVIYNAIDDIESAMKGMLDPIYEERVIGHVEVRQTFKASGIGTIAGSFVQDGAVERNASARISRGGSQIWEGKIASLKRFNDDAKEVKAGYECGIVFEDYSDVREGDIAEIYKMVEIPRD